MSLEAQAASLSADEIVSLLTSNQELREERDSLKKENESLEQENESLEQAKSSLEQDKENLKHQLEWFKRQVFGEKSERRVPEFDSRQLSLGEALEVPETPPPPKETVKKYERRCRKEPWETDGGEDDDESGLRFDDSVPVKVIKVDNPELEGLVEGEDYEVLSEKVTHRLAQQPSSYMVLTYVRKVVKLKGSEEIVTPAAPPAVIEKSLADVSFLVGLLVEKFLYHLPLYRQHQRLSQAGISISRGTLTNLVHRSAELLEPIYFALLSSIVQSQVLAMDETSIKAGRSKSQRKMHKGYFWPIYGDKDEIAFPFSPSRALSVAQEALGEFCGVLVTDGYKVYERYAEKTNTVVHAQCWSHARRKFVEAEKVEPTLVGIALEYIRKLYRVEKHIQEQGLKSEEILRYRWENSSPVVEEYFKWLDTTFQEQVLLPSSPFTKAANYSLQREEALKVFLRYPDVPLDTNHLERQIRAVAMGRKNYLFCWTEVGARFAGIIYSLIASCKVQGIDPRTYLIDVLQRIDSHPAKDIHLLTPRLWKENFAENPLSSDLDGG